MGEINQDYDVNKDIEFYLQIRNIAHNTLTKTDADEIQDDKDLKKIKLILDIGDKSIQNRIKLLLQLGKIDIDPAEFSEEAKQKENRELSEILFQISDREDIQEDE
ncbi:MAG: hypothetical protein ACOCV8_01630 [Spirochaetota bacterium]